MPPANVLCLPPRVFGLLSSQLLLKLWLLCCICCCSLSSEGVHSILQHQSIHHSGWLSKSADLHNGHQIETDLRLGVLLNPFLNLGPDLPAMSRSAVMCSVVDLVKPLISWAFSQHNRPLLQPIQLVQLTLRVHITAQQYLADSATTALRAHLMKWNTSSLLVACFSSSETNGSGLGSHIRCAGKVSTRPPCKAIVNISNQLTVAHR